MRQLPTQPRGNWALSILILLVSVLFYSLYYNRGMLLVDEGMLVHGAQRVARGEVLYRDFYHWYAPGNFYILAGLFRIFGESFLVSRMMWVGVRALCVLLVFLIGCRFMPRRFAILPASVVLFVPGPWFKSFYAFGGLLSLWTILRFVDHHTLPRVIAASLSVGLALLLRQDVGVEAGTALFGAVLLCHVAHPASDNSWSRTLRNLLAGILVLGAVLLPVAFYFHCQGALAMMKQLLFSMAPSYTLSRWDSIPRIVFKTLKYDGFLFLLFITPVIALLGSATILLSRLRAGAFQREELSLALLAFMGMCSMIPAYLPTAPIRVYQCASIIWILVAYLLWWGYDTVGSYFSRRMNSPPRVRVVKSVAYLGIVLAFAYGILNVLMVERPRFASTVYGGTITGALKNRCPVTLRGERIFLTCGQADWIPSLVSYVQNHTAEGEPIVVLPNEAMFYYLCDRSNPTRFLGDFSLKYPDSVNKSLWREFVAETEMASPRYVIVNQKFLGPRSKHYLKDYLTRFYRKVAQFSDFAVMARNRS